MHRSILFVFLFAGMSLLNGCRTQRDITYLADMKNDSLLRNLPEEAPEYILRPGDNLYVNIQSTNEEVTKLFNINSTTPGGGSPASGDPSGQFLYGNLVGRDGNITLPVLGQIQVAGLSQSEAQARVQLKANEYLKEVTVKLKLLNFKVTMLGEIRSPGVYYFFDNSLNILDGVARAGGFTEMADLRKILVVRKTSAGTRSYRVDVTTKHLLSDPAYYLQPKDVIYAQSAKIKVLQINSQTISLIISTFSFLLIIFRL